MLNAPELMIIAGVVVVMFGSSKLPKLGSAVGETIKNFKKGIQDDESKNAQIAPTKEDETKKP